ncbi:hypothetical protein BV22DRAFT_1135671 [Leucogyrophana mollusca]|uniref:Uncharacterized protein n=1 Tax=Leucogyrophana mollusca TaxID=85980 RepID=A0ACB8AV50_9AGAM|nr:hypothetical protein BV22DRAFT_1135671 [Leucogyrophana mollusca]
MYMDWDSEVVDLYLEYGAYCNSSGQVCLKVQSAHEAVLAVDRVNCQSACYFLPSLSSKLPVFFIYGAKSLLLPRWSQTLASKLPPLAESVWVEAGHMMAQEKPELLGMFVMNSTAASIDKIK